MLLRSPRSSDDEFEGAQTNHADFETGRLKRNIFVCVLYRFE